MCNHVTHSRCEPTSLCKPARPRAPIEPCFALSTLPARVGPAYADEELAHALAPRTRTHTHACSAPTLRVTPPSQPSPRGRFALRRARKISATAPPPPHTERVGPAYANHELTRTRAPRARTHTRALPPRCAWRPLARASPRVVADSCADEHSRISPWPRSLARTAPYRAATRVPAPLRATAYHLYLPSPSAPQDGLTSLRLVRAHTFCGTGRTPLCGTVTSRAPLRLVGLTSPLVRRHLLPSPALGGVRRGGGVRKGVRLATVEHRPGVHFCAGFDGCATRHSPALGGAEHLSAARVRTEAL